jgi:hypothetical protein
MHRSVIGKTSLRVGLLMALLLGLSLLQLTACGVQDSAKGGAGQENNSARGRGRWSGRPRQASTSSL